MHLHVCERLLKTEPAMCCLPCITSTKPIATGTAGLSSASAQSTFQYKPSAGQVSTQSSADSARDHTQGVSNTVQDYGKPAEAHGTGISQESKTPVHITSKAGLRVDTTSFAYAVAISCTCAAKSFASDHMGHHNIERRHIGQDQAQHVALL